MPFPENVSFLFSPQNVDNHISLFSYVLYGAIKSGKSTVMRIILNLCKTDHGNLTILGNNMVNRSVTFGYMPQRKGLDPYLTIYETVKFYGTLKGMNQPAIMTVFQY